MPPLKLNALNQQNAPFKQTEQSLSNKGDSTAESSPKDKPTLSVANVQPFVPAVKILDEVKTKQPVVSDNNKDVVVVSQNTTTVPTTTIALPAKKQMLNPETVAFVPSKAVLTQTAAAAAAKVVRPLVEAPPRNILPVTQVGGFGNK